MWHLEEPSRETLDWFKKLFLDDVCNSIRTNLPQEVKDVLLPNDSQAIIETLMTESATTLYAHNKELEDDLRAKGQWTDDNVKKLFAAFDYDGRISKNKRNSYELSRRISRSTCVYCNRIYAFDVVDHSTGKKITRPDFDHWLAKADHPLVSMSFYNLIPSCPICNRSIKNQQEFKYGTHLHPYLTAPETSFRFRYSPLPNNQWDVIMDGCTPEERATAQILETEQVYKVHGNMEVKDMVDFAYRNTPEYLSDLYQHVMMAYGGKITPVEAYKVITGSDSTPDKFLDRPLAKLKRDVMLQLQETLGVKILP